MRIAFISYEYPPDTVTGGIGTYISQVTSLLEKAGCLVHIFAGSHYKNEENVENGIWIHRIHCNDPHDFQTRVLNTFEKEHEKHSFQILESPEIHANAAVIRKKYPELLLIVRLHAPNILVESLKKSYIPFKIKLRFFLGALRRFKWDLGYWRKYDPNYDIDYLFTRQADIITAPTIQMKNWAVKKWELQPATIKVIQNPFIIDEAFKNAVTCNKEHIILFYGRLNVLKGLITITKSMAKLLADHPGWKWIVIGEDGPAADGNSSMRAWMIKKLVHVIEKVTFIDPVPHHSLPVWLKQVSIVVVPSLFESFSYVVIEAATAGKAIVGSRGTGISSIISHENNGLLATPGNTNDWIKQLGKLMNDEGLRYQLGQAAYKSTALNKADMNNEIISFYKSLVT